MHHLHSFALSTCFLAGIDCYSQDFCSARFTLRSDPKPRNSLIVSCSIYLLLSDATFTSVTLSSF